MPLPEETVAALNASWKDLHWSDRLRSLARIEEKRISFSTSFSLEDQIITHIILSEKLPISLFTLDTGRLFPETYTTWQQTEERYGIRVTPYFPERDKIEEFVQTNGINGFYNSVDTRHACCHIRKVEPLNRALQGVDFWISGLRGGHSDFRSSLPFAEWDVSRRLIKLHPVLDTEEADIREFIRQENIPYNALYDRGFTSIGCAPCTRAVQPGEDPRAGRWWWELEADKECGLHLVDGKLVRISEAPHA